jgi:integrase
MSDIDLCWGKIIRGLPRGKRYANDRAGRSEEIRRLCEYPDRRIKPIVYTMVSSGIRASHCVSTGWSLGYTITCYPTGDVVCNIAQSSMGEGLTDGSRDCSGG